MLFIHLPVDGPLDCFQFWLIMNEAVRNRHFPLPLKYPYASLSYFLTNSVPMSSLQKGLLWLLYLKWHFPLLSRPYLLFYFFKALSINIIYIIYFKNIKIYRETVLVTVLQRNRANRIYLYMRIRTRGNVIHSCNFKAEI